MLVDVEDRVKLYYPFHDHVLKIDVDGAFEPNEYLFAGFRNNELGFGPLWKIDRGETIYTAVLAPIP